MTTPRRTPANRPITTLQRAHKRRSSRPLPFSLLAGDLHAVWSMLVQGHFTAGEAARALEDAAKCLRRGGYG
jgi:hypothetical protein